jgi:hypothetical protein
MFATEEEVVLRLTRLRDEYDAVSQAVRDAQNRQRYLESANEVAAAAADEKRLLSEMSRLMDRLRAIEAYLSCLRRGEEPRFL